MLGIGLMQAQWTTNYAQNTSVANIQAGVPYSNSTTDGKTFIAYWKSGDPSGYQMYVQLLDQNGNKILGDNGIQLGTDINMSTYTFQFNTSVDKDNNFYVAFTETGGLKRSFVHKISPQGVQLWGTDGIILAADTYDVKVFPDPNSSNFYLTYMSDNDGVIEKYNADKVMVWSAPQLVGVPSGSIISGVGEGGVLSDGSFVALIHARATAWTTNSNLYAQRYNASTGSPVWSTMTKISSKTTNYNRRYTTITDGDVIYIGYTGTTSSRFDSFLQRINADGTLPWDINGKDFSITDNYYEMEATVAMQPGSQYIWEISKMTTESQGSIGTFVQKFDKNTGERLLSDGAKEVFNVESNYKQPIANLRMHGDKPTFLTINSNFNGTNSTPISISALNDDGSFYFTNQLIDIATSDAAKGSISFSGGSGNNFVAVWEEVRNGGDHTFAQNYDFDDYLSVNNASEKNRALVYPNPVSNYLTILSDEKVSEVKVFNLSGQLIAQSYSDKINFSSFPKGNYIIHIKDIKGNTTTQKVIKE